VRRLLPLIVVLAAVVPAVSFAQGSTSATLPPIKHVFVIVLENESESTSFGPTSPAPYLAQTLPAIGEYLPNYYGVGHHSLDNYIAMISGQGPNPSTEADCGTFSDFVPGTAGPNGQAVGTGCVYPSSVATIAGQLSGVGDTWKAYEQDMGNTPARESATCGHPNVGSVDGTEGATAADQYATRHDPFVYFHSIIDSTACQQDVVNFTQLASDLKSVSSTPNYSFITPNLCNDGHDAPCANGQPGGLVSAGQFLASAVPEILASPAYRKNGLLIVTFDESGSGDESCCGEPADTMASNGGNSPNPGGGAPGDGGGLVGAVLVSPYIKGGTTTQTSYNHYSMLASIEDLFGLQHLGFAGVAGLPTFDSGIFNLKKPALSSAVRLGLGAWSDTGSSTAGCMPAAAPSGGKQASGTFIYSAALSASGGTETLSLTLHAAGKVAVSVKLHGKRHAVAELPLQGSPCNAYQLVLPHGAGAATVRVSGGGAFEQKALPAAHG